MFFSTRGARNIRLRPFFRRLYIEHVEARQLLAALVGDSPWQNPVEPLDVTGDGYVSAEDAILLRHFLQEFGPGPVPEDATAAPPYYDTNGDGAVTGDDQELVEASFAPLPCGIYQNQRNPLDVDGDTQVTINDVRDIDRYLDRLARGVEPCHVRSGFLDVNGDGAVTSADQLLVSIAVTPENVAPVSHDSGGRLADSDETLVVAAPGVLDSASDYNLDPLQAVLVSTTAHGKLTLLENGGYIYTPDPGFVGEDSFTFQVDDGRDTDHLSAVSKVTIVVRDSALNPIGQPDAYATRGDTPLVVDGRGVLANDERIMGRMSAVIVTRPAHGTLSFPLKGDTFAGAFTYTPKPGFVGVDTFVYQALQETYVDEPYVNRWSDFVTVTIDVTRPIQNSENPLDVNDDGYVAANDVLDVINMLNARRSTDDAEGEASDLYYDVTGDGFLAPGDALAIINHLNLSVGHDQAEIADTTAGEGESAESILQAQAAVDEALLLLNLDEACNRRRK